MTQDEARGLVEALIEELDEDVLLGSMLYAMTDSEKRRLTRRLEHCVLRHVPEPA